jgi:diguanylate cyclase (GGDEF)-like protein
VEDLEQELVRLRRELAEARAQARANEDIFRRSHAREMSLLQAGTLQGLLEVMVAGLKESFELEAVTLVVRDIHHEIRQLASDEERGADSPDDVIFVESLEVLAPQYGVLWQPWLGPFMGADHGLIFPGRADIASCALIPLRRQDEFIGCLNLGSSRPDRFTRHHATDFLSRLGDIAAVCLEGAINRARLVRSGTRDVLTGLYNRRYLHDRLADELARARRDGRSLACVLVDVDRFKSVNDRWGHPAGDRVLMTVSHVIHSCCRDSDVAVRFGGEEFAVLLPGAGAAEAATVAERIRRAVEAATVEVVPGTTVPLTVSAGVSGVQPGDLEEGDLKSLGERLIAEADVQLYRAKSEGRNRVRAVA